MVDTTWLVPDLDGFCGLDAVGVSAVGMRLEPDRSWLLCDVALKDADRFCGRCGVEGRVRDTDYRRLAHLPFGHRPTTLLLRLRRFRCADCQHVWVQNCLEIAKPRSKLSTPAVTWALEAIVLDHMSISRVAANLGVTWHTVNSAIMDAAKEQLFADPQRFAGVGVIGVDEHCWRHTRKGDKFVTVIIDLTPVRDGRGPSRLLDVVDGRSKEVFKTWLANRPPEWQRAVEVVAMDGFTGFKTATTEELPDAVAVMDPFHVVRLAGQALDDCRCRVQQQVHGHRGRKNDPLYKARRTMLTGINYLTDRQWDRLNAVFENDEYVEVAATWGIYQKMITAYRHQNRKHGKDTMIDLIESISHNVPAALEEVASLGRTLKRRAADILAYFDNPGTSNGPSEAINGRLEWLRGSALGFRNITNYIARCLLECGGFKQKFKLAPHP